MRAGPRAMAVALLLLTASCTERGGTGEGAPTTAPTVTSIAPPTAVPTVPSTTAPTATTTLPAGSVTLRVTGFTLPDLRSGGTGLRLLVQASSPRLTVSRRGAGGAVSACPVAGATAPVAPRDCVDLPAAGGVDLASGGVELRATGADAAVDEVSVVYAPSSRATTIITPARPAGACETRACQATFSLLPTRPGPFLLDGRGSGGRPRFVLTAVPLVAGAGSNRTLATVEGGGQLSINATLDAVSAASLLHHEQGPGPVASVTAEILWP